MPSALILILGRATLWQVRRACGGLRRSRLRCSCDAAKAQRVQFELLLPCVPGALPEEADPRECFARNTERAGRLSRKGALHRMSSSAEGALLPTSRGKDDERALMPAALICGFEHSERSRPTDWELTRRPALAPVSSARLHRCSCRNRNSAYRKAHSHPKGRVQPAGVQPYL